MDHQYYMQRALELAVMGWPDVAPNPMVGCVIAKNGKIVAEGYHHKFGEAHAEVNAIAALPVDISPSDCTLYVTLEPCTHFGKTAPCADLVINSGFRHVVVASADPNPLVSGKGITSLRKHGINVEVGVLEDRARLLNKRFMTFFEKKRPYIILKWAITADGFISREMPADRSANLITREAANISVHQLRAETMAILVGKNTVLTDDPGLTTRLVKGKNPIRLFIDGNLEVSDSYKILNADAPTVVFNYVKEAQERNIIYIQLEKHDVVRQILDKLYNLNIQSVLVEGGAKLLQEFIDKKLWDEAFVYENADLRFGTGVKGPVFALKSDFEKKGEDRLYRHQNF